MDALDRNSQSKTEPQWQFSVRERLEQCVTRVIGEDAMSFLEISDGSSFIHDLEMDSIQLIHLAEQVNSLYGDRVDFIGWLSTKPVKGLLALTVGDVARFIEEKTDGAA